MADESTTIVIDTKEKLATRIRGARLTLSWQIFSSFLQELSSAAERNTDKESVTVNAGGTQFPLDSTVQFLPAYLQTDFIDDVFPDLAQPAQYQVRATVQRVIDEKAQTLQDSLEKLDRRRQTQADFITTLRQRIDTLLPQLDESIDVPITQAIPDIINNQGSVTAASNSVSPDQIRQLEEEFKKVDKARTLLKKAESIKLKDAQKSELEKRQALKNRNPDTFTAEEAAMFSQLEEAQEKIEEAQESLQEALTKYDKETLDAVEVRDAQVLISEYEPTATFSELLIKRLLDKYTKEEIADYSGNPYPLSDAIHNLLVAIAERLKKYLEKIEKDYKEKQAEASEALNKELAITFNIPVEADLEDTGGASSDDEDTDQDEQTPEETEPADEDESTEIIENFSEQLAAFERQIYDLIPDYKSREKALEDLKYRYSGGSAREGIEADSITEFIDRVAQLAVDGKLTQQRQKDILELLRSFVAGLEAQAERLEKPEEQPASVPPIPGIEPEELVPEVGGAPSVRQTGALLKVQSLLVLEAQNEIRYALEQSGFTQEEIGQYLDAYHDDLSDLVWSNFLNIGGFGRLKQGDSINYHELARIWHDNSQVVLEKIWLDTRTSGQPTLYAKLGQTIGRIDPTEAGFQEAMQVAGITPEQVTRAEDILNQAGIENHQATLALMQRLQDPTFFNGLIEQANAVAELQSALKNSYSSTGNFDQQELDRLIALLLPYLPENLRNTTIAGDLATLTTAGNATRLLRSADYEARFKNLNILQKSGAWLRLQRLQRLIEKLEKSGVEPTKEEASELETLLREFAPIFSILQDGDANELFFYVVGAEELNRFAGVLAETQKQELAVAKRLESFSGMSYQPYGQSLRSFVPTRMIQVTEVTEITETTEVSLLTDARDNMLLKKLVIASLMQDAARADLQMNIEQQQALYAQLAMQSHSSLEALLFRPDLQQQPASWSSGGQQLTAAGQLASLQRQSPSAKVNKMRQFAHQARLAKMLMSSGGNPYLMAANLLKDPEGRKMIMKAVKAMVAFIMANLFIVLALIMAVITAIVAFFQAIANFILGILRGIGDFVVNVVNGITGTGGGSSAIASTGSATGQAILAGTKNAASTATTAGNEIAQNIRSEATSAFNSATSQVTTLVSSTVTLETAGGIIAAGLGGPLLLIAVMTIIVITVIGASLNDLPSTGLQRQVSQGGLGVAGCWPVSGQIKGLETYPGGTPHATSDGGSAIDIAAPTGTPIFTPFSGTAHSAWNDDYGNYVIIETDYGFTVYLAHMLEACVQSLNGGCLAAGQSGPVTAGQQVGLVGSTGNSTGPHVHYEVLNVPSSLTTSDYAIAEIVPPEPPLAFDAIVSTSQCGTGNAVEINACFRFQDGPKDWSESEKTGIQTVIAAIEANGQASGFQNRLCGKGPISLVRHGSSSSSEGFPYSGEVVSSSAMYIYDYCFDDSQANCQFTFPHELGHIYHNRQPGIQGRMSNATSAESLIFTYPLSPGNAVNEKFAEAFGLYIAQEWLGFNTYRCLAGRPNTEQGNNTCESFSFRSRYPLQYQFMQESVF